MAGRRRGRTGRGWDAAPPRKRRSTASGAGSAGSNPPGSVAGSSAAGSSAGGSATGGSATGAGWAADGPDAASAPETPEKAAERAREICLRQLAVRPRTRAELAAALRGRGIPDEVSEEVLGRYSEVGMIDDAAFARAWVSSRHHGKGLARRALGSELRRRGVDPETVGDALGQLDPDTETETARTLVERKLRTASGDPQALLRRMVGMLARKGYPAGLAFRVVKEVLAADERTAELAERLDPDALADAAGEMTGDEGSASG